MHQHEAAGAIGVFGLTRAKASLAKQSALLVAGNAAYRYFATQPLRLGITKIAGRWVNLGQHRRGDAKQRQQLIIPAVGVHIQEHGPSGIADVGSMNTSATELPHQPTVHGAKGQLPRFGHGASAADVVQNPLQLGGRKIGVDQ